MNHRTFRTKWLACLLSTLLIPTAPPSLRAAAPTTPIQHLVVIVQEQISFDHYFGTYPTATNTDGSAFNARKGTPEVNGLTPALLTHNPNEFNPTRLSHSEALTCDQDHGYTDEQKAFNNGLMNEFVQDTERSACKGQPVLFGAPGIVMDYYDGNTVTALWNYAQNFVMSDNNYATTFGPSTPGSLNLISGQTHGATSSAPAAPVDNGTVIGDIDPFYDACSSTTTLSMTGKNVGDLLNAQNITWGWFEAGFRPTSTTGGKVICAAEHTNIGGVPVPDYSPHHEPFQYYQSTANPNHLPPSSPGMIGKTDQANHQYDLSDFFTALAANNLPSVSFLKAPEYEDGHPGYSDPLDEQRFLVNTINRIQESQSWPTTAIIIIYDGSDGWYDHQMGPIVNPSDSAQDALTGSGSCGTAKAGAYLDRCGYGPRIPLLVISPFAKVNFVNHAITDETSVLRFIEDNWNLGRIGDQSFDALAGSLKPMFDFQQNDQDGNSQGGPTPILILDPTTGEPVPGQPVSGQNQQ